MLDLCAFNKIFFWQLFVISALWKLRKICTMVLTIQEQTLELSPERVVFWKEKKWLILSDMHLGKGGHFRKSGIPIPNMIQEQDLSRLDKLIEQFQPERIVVAGDMFHSENNREIEQFFTWRNRHSLRYTLVPGNHDILKTSHFSSRGIEVIPDQLKSDPFVITHEPFQEKEPAGFTISGHIHPGIRLQGSGKQYLRFPCFWMSKRGLVLPAFGQFTGLQLIDPAAGDSVYVIADGELFHVSTL